MQLTNIKIPFMGFYETSASAVSEFRGFIEWCNLNGLDFNDQSELDDDHESKWLDWWSDNYHQYEQNLASDYASNLNYEIKRSTGIDLDLDSVEIKRPKEYNFTTDCLFVDANTDKLIELFNKVDKDILKQVIKDNFTSYDGFYSYYDNDDSSEQWRDPKNYDHNQWDAVIQAVMREHNIDQLTLLD